MSTWRARTTWRCIRRHYRAGCWRKVFGAGQVELYGGGGTDLDVGLRAFIERTHDPIDLLVIVSDCHTTWSNDLPPFPVITIRVGDGAPPPWGNRGGNTVISIEDRRG